MYVRPFTTLRLDAIATASGQCQIMVPDTKVTPPACVPSAIVEERTINHIYSWVDITSNSQNGTVYPGQVFGKNPNGTTAFWHVLDTTQTNSTGPLYFGIGLAGSYALHFQANINTTACNIQPNVTPQADITVHARTTLHRGGACSNGSLIGAASLPRTGTVGYYQFPGTDTPGTDNWGGAESSNRLIQTVGTQWAQNHPTPRIRILDLSRQNGGEFRNQQTQKKEHKCHQNGLDIDVRYVGNNGETAIDLMNTKDLTNVYNRSATIDLMRLFAANGSISRIIVDPNAGISSADVPNTTIELDVCQEPDITQCRGHRDHFHVALNDPDGPDSNNCP
jgi:murein endopeptidase